MRTPSTRRCSPSRSGWRCSWCFKLYPFVRPALVNGAAGAVVAPHRRLFSVMAFAVTNGKITQIDALVDPARLARLDLTLPGP
jgi:hypothetical protein